jgi:hypothetical protein
MFKKHACLQYHVINFRWTNYANYILSTVSNKCTQNHDLKTPRG